MEASVTTPRIRRIGVTAVGLCIVAAGALEVISGAAGTGYLKVATGAVVASTAVFAAQISTASGPTGVDGGSYLGRPPVVGFYTMISVGALQQGFNFFPSEVAVPGTMLAGLLAAGVSVLEGRVAGRG